MGILDSLLTSQNVERGVNLLQSNKGIVDALAHNLTFLPSSGRLYAKNLAGSTTPINEDFFSESQLAEIKNRTAMEMADRSMMYEEKNKYGNIPWDLRNKVVSYDLNRKPISLSGIFSDTGTDIDATLGQFTYKENPDGTISAIDKHDFDSFGGGETETYGGKISFSGLPEYTEKGLPFLEPEFFPATVDKFSGEELAPAVYETKTDYSYQTSDEVLQEALDLYKQGLISTSKLARIIGGQKGQTGDDINWEFYKDIEHMRPDWDRSGIPININLGKISHLDKLKANKDFARYIAETETIPSRIRKEAQKIVPKRTAPIHSPHGGGPGTGGDGYRASRPASERQHTGHGKSGMGRDPRDRMAMGGLIDLYRYGGFI